MVVTAGLDSGPVCAAEAEPIRADDTYGTLSPRLVDLSARLLVRVLDEDPPCLEQPEEGVTYAEKISAADRTLGPVAPSAEERERVVRALHPHIGARLQLPDGSFLGVRRARAGADGELELLEVQPPGRAGDVLRGLPPRAPVRPPADPPTTTLRARPERSPGARPTASWPSGPPAAARRPRRRTSAAPWPSTASARSSTSSPPPTAPPRRRSSS